MTHAAKTNRPHVRRFSSISRDGPGVWIVRDTSGRCVGIFAAQIAALRFARQMDGNDSNDAARSARQRRIDTLGRKGLGVGV